MDPEIESAESSRLPLHGNPFAAAPSKPTGLQLHTGVVALASGHPSRLRLPMGEAALGAGLHRSRTAHAADGHEPDRDAQRAAGRRYGWTIPAIGAGRRRVLSVAPPV